MANEKAKIQFLGYEVVSLKYVRCDCDPDQTTFELSPRFIQEIGQGEDNHYSLKLSVLVNEEGLPFDIEVVCEGHFKLENIDDPEMCMRVNATAILYPYIRASISTLTALASIPPVVLPTINTGEVFGKKNEKAE